MLKMLANNKDLLFSSPNGGGKHRAATEDPLALDPSDAMEDVKNGGGDRDTDEMCVFFCFIHYV
jgi:hypothetical protein